MPNKTAATIPITENDQQYYSGQYGPLENTSGGVQTVWRFPDLNTVLISNYDSIGGDQVRDTGNFDVHLLATSSTTPSSSNKIDSDQVIVTDTTNNTIQINTADAIPDGQFIFLQLTTIATGDNYGSYGYLTLNDIISNFQLAYTGEGQILNRVSRTQILFHARRAVQELSYDVLKAYKAQELTVPTNLTCPIPRDYVNYVNAAWADQLGVLHTIYPLWGLSGSPTELPVQDGTTGVPTQSSYGNNLQASQSVIEDRWENANDNEITGDYDPYDDSGVYDYRWWKTAFGGRYGLDAETTQRNGWFNINPRTGMFTFSAGLVNKVIQLTYISDGLGTDLNSILPKLAEEALYAQILYRLSMTRSDVDGGTKAFLKRDSYVKTRNAKIRLSDLKLDEIVQIFRGQSKWIKH
tara:strand:- start:1352 stop:2578 length:1227 start_codon:yes stop_codon:yes gene_type:complete